LKKLPLVTKSPQTVAPCKEEEHSLGAAAPKSHENRALSSPFQYPTEDLLLLPFLHSSHSRQRPKFKTKKFAIGKKAKCYTRDYAKLAPFFWFSQVKRKREREREIQTGRSKPKASRYEET
jgi:hypothetical protein